MYTHILVLGGFDLCMLKGVLHIYIHIHTYMCKTWFCIRPHYLCHTCTVYALTSSLDIFLCIYARVYARVCACIVCACSIKCTDIQACMHVCTHWRQVAGCSKALAHAYKYACHAHGIQTRINHTPWHVHPRGNFTLSNHGYCSEGFCMALLWEKKH